MSTSGHVAIVGAGPGDPELVTVKAVRMLAAADVVLIDALASHEVLAHCRDDVEVIDVGKRRGHHTASQEDIEAVMLEHAGRGRRVVRLKGGDPFVFGRGGEEVLACQRAGIAYDVVPGISSALAVPAWAGIPVTHRGLSQHVTVVSGHVPPGHRAGTVDWRVLGSLGGTVVVLMGMANLDAIATALVAGGRSAGTPAAVVREGTTDSGTVLLTTLGSLAAATAAAGVSSPAVVVVGEVASLADQARATISSRMVDMNKPLVIAAHGTRDARGLRTVEAVAARVATLAPDRRVHVGYLDVASPTVGDVFARLTGPCVVVPMLLAPGYHVDVDLPEVAGDAPHPVAVTAPLGPDERLLAVVQRRLVEAGWSAPEPVVLGAAGSSSAASRAVTASVAESLALRLGVSVVPAYASAARPTPAEAVAQLRAGGAPRVALATYLLAPGEFADRMLQAGADVVSAPLGDAPEVAEVLLARAIDHVRQP